MRFFNNTFLLLSFIIGLGITSPGQAGSELNLPDLGGGSSSIISRQQEHELGQAWLRLFRSRVQAYLDPYLTDYLEHLLKRLSVSSQLQDKRLSLITVDNPTINAFAAPGGIIGVHTGLLLHARSEHELAAVLAHELAHLSQRHWIRSLQQARQNKIPTMAALLASLVLIATSNTEAGMAALTATQAAGLESSLRFSRSNETEADNIGMYTLQKAGFDPNAMAAMFERMLQATRFQGERPPEFLLTHPVTESRIASSKSRAANLPVHFYADNLAFHLVRARLQLHHSENASIAAKRFQSEIDGKSVNIDASYYGLAVAQMKNKKLDEAEIILMRLLKTNPREKYYLLAKAQLDFLRGQTEPALKQLQYILDTYEEDFAAQLLQVDIYRQTQQYATAEAILNQLSQQRPNNEVVWYELAEIRGLAGDIAGLHIARAEYYILNGIYDLARQQLEFALKLYPEDSIDTIRIQHRMKDIKKLEDYTINI